MSHYLSSIRNRNLSEIDNCPENPEKFGLKSEVTKMIARGIVSYDTLVQIWEGEDVTLLVEIMMKRNLMFALHVTEKERLYFIPACPQWRNLHNGTFKQCTT